MSRSQFHLTSLSSYDPWNQTAADNAEWLRRFKRDAGILTDSSLPGLPQCTAWNVSQGGSGFSPPYLFPNPAKAAHMTPFPQDTGTLGNGAPTKPSVVSVPASAATRFIQALPTRHPPPPSVFCSRELERELCGFVAGEVLATGGGVFPSDEAIRERARAFLRTDRTAADDPVLLGKFKDMMKARLGLAGGSASAGHSGDGGGGGSGGGGGERAGQTGEERQETTGLAFAAGSAIAPGPGPAPVPAAPVAADAELSATMGAEFGDVVQHMDFDFDLGDLMGGGGEEMTMGQP